MCLSPSCRDRGWLTRVGFFEGAPGVCDVCDIVTLVTFVIVVPLVPVSQRLPVPGSVFPQRHGDAMKQIATAVPTRYNIPTQKPTRVRTKSLPIGVNGRA